MTEQTTGTEAQPSQFDALLADIDGLETLNKALAEPEPEPENEEEEEDTSAIRENGDEAREGAAAKPTLLGKSLTVQIDGQDAEVLDAEALVEVLTKTVEGQTAQGSQIEILGKGLTAALGTIKALAGKVQEQSSLIKALGNQPGGRKSQLQAAPKPSTAPRNADEVMAKCMGWLGEGSMTAAEVSTVEGHLNAGTSLPPALLQRLAAA